MTVSHELGHVVGAIVQGARPIKLNLLPWQIPSSLFQGESQRWLTLWAGPLIGCAFPASIAWITQNHQARFVAAFCLLANGIYLLIGYFSGDAFLDSTLMVRADTPILLLLAVAAVMTVVGYVVFRRSCVELLGRAKIANLTIVYHFIGWVMLLIVQTIMAVLIS